MQEKQRVGDSNLLFYQTYHTDPSHPQQDTILCRAVGSAPPCWYQGSSRSLSIFIPKPVTNLAAKWDHYDEKSYLWESSSLTSEGIRAPILQDPARSISSDRRAGTLPGSKTHCRRALSTKLPLRVLKKNPKDNQVWAKHMVTLITPQVRANTMSSVEHRVKKNDGFSNNSDAEIPTQPR